MPLLLTLRTLRHLRKDQILGQIRLRLKRLLGNPQRFARIPVPDYPGCRWEPLAGFLPPGAQENTSADIIAGMLTFLNRREDIGWPPDWARDDLPKLWLYNTHYFDYLWALEYPQAKTLLLEWIANHQLRRGSVGWEPYPTSLRLASLCGVLFDKFRNETEADLDFRGELWRSIFLQAEWLSRNLETHLLGNHLFENAAALAFAGSCFGGDAAENWLRIGKRLLSEQVPEQILSDGGHFERSPMYHLRIAWLLAGLINTGNAELKSMIEEPLERMISALSLMCHPDGRIALLNDSAFGICNEPADLLSYASGVLGKPLPALKGLPGPFALPESGYYGVRHDDGTYLICDAGPIGPDYIPGHAHGDMLSFELSLSGHRVIVDSGVHDYELGSMRDYCRSTKAHNTVEINGLDQCEFWAAFRVARRGRPHDVTWQPFEDGFRLSARHDGYRRLAGGPDHHREFIWKASDGLEVRDTIVSSRPVSVVSRLHLHPDCTIDAIEGNGVRIAFSAGIFRVRFTGDGELSVEESFYCPGFGEVIDNKALAFSANGSRIEIGLHVDRVESAEVADQKPQMVDRSCGSSS